MLGKLSKALIKPFEKSRLNQVIFFVTSKCNLRCQHCFYWRSLNKSDDLRFEEIEKISQNLPNFNLLLLSGGEPFLREELVEIIRLFWKNNRISFVGIPTNGTLTTRIVSQTKKILEIDPKLSVNLYFSIDGLAPLHDSIRRVKGSFKKALKSIREVNNLKKHHQNLSVNINTVISASNLKEIEQFINFIRSQGKSFIDGHYFELVRGSPRNPAVKNIDKKKLRRLYGKVILPYQEEIYKRRALFLSPFLAKLATTNLGFLYNCQYHNFSSNQPWSMPCLAGRSIVVIDSNGDLRFCEMRSPVTNLKKVQYSLKKFLSTEKAERELVKIKKERCFCTHGCFITESMYKDSKVMFVKLPFLFFKIFKKFALE